MALADLFSHVMYYLHLILRGHGVAFVIGTPLGVALRHLLKYMLNMSMKAVVNSFVCKNCLFVKIANDL